MDLFQVLSAEQQEVLVEAINQVINLNQKEYMEFIIFQCAIQSLSFKLYISFVLLHTNRQRKISNRNFT